MNALLSACCGVPLPPGYEEEAQRAFFFWLKTAPVILVVFCVIATVLSGLYRYNERFREFWERHVCGWMERHQ